MNNKSNLLLILCLSVAVTLPAQNKITYSAGFEADVLKSSEPASGLFAFTHGVTYRRTSAGIGGGIDFYRYRTIPLFIDVKQVLATKRFQPYAEAAIGINIANPTETEKMQTDHFWNNNNRFYNGLFTKVAAGIVLNPRHKLRVTASIGYSYKTIKVTSGQYDVTDPWLGLSPFYTDRYRLSRWCLGMGIWL